MRVVLATISFSIAMLAVAGLAQAQAESSTPTKAAKPGMIAVTIQVKGMT